MAAQRQDFWLWAGDTLTLRISVENAAGETVPLDGATVEWLLGHDRDCDEPVLAKNNTSLGGVTVAGAVASVALAPVDTIGLAAGTYYHQTRVTLVDGTASVVSVGEVLIHPIIKRS